MSKRWTAAEAAKLWMEHHNAEEWRALLLQYDEVPVSAF
jgi:hypothetical protein